MRRPRGPGGPGSSSRSGPPAHLADHPVAVQVEGGVLVGEAVVVLVHRAHGASVGLGGVEVEVRAVGVVLRAQVDGRPVQEPGDLGIVPVAFHQVLHQPEHRLGRGDLAGVATPSKKAAGLSVAGPVAVLVRVAWRMGRPS
jgi:hypothetical protein